MAKTKTPKLRVMFDTNILYTQVASDLVRHSIKTLIKENSQHTDLIIEWYIPEIVVGERRFQMLTKASELLPSMQKMEKLLGHKFGIAEDTLEMYVNNAIDTNINELGFLVAGISVSDVDWNEIISRSVTRKPPFEENEKEKGFRDSVIANSFIQLHEASPATPGICKLIFVSEDKRLREYVQELTKTAKNIRILSSQDELESLINTLISELPEDFAEELTKKASKLFFEKKNEKTFYYKQGISDRIKEQYDTEGIEKSPVPSLLKSTTGKTWWITEPVFMRKDKSRIYWTSTIQPEFELYRIEKSDAGQVTKPFSTTEFPAITLFSRSFDNEKKIVESTGRDIFEVHWSTNLSQAKNLTSPKLEKIVYVGNSLQE